MTDQVRANASRVSISSTNDAGTEQYHSVAGLPGEAFTKVMSARQHGFSSHPPVGSHGIMVAMQGRRDLVVVLGGESPSHRPTGLAEGATEVYDTAGSNMHLDAAGNIVVTATDTITITAPTSIKLVVGTASIVITDGEVEIIAPGGLTITAPSGLTTGNLSVGTGATGTFTSATGVVITVQNGIIVDIY